MGDLLASITLHPTKEDEAPVDEGEIHRVVKIHVDEEVTSKPAELAKRPTT